MINGQVGECVLDINCFQIKTVEKDSERDFDRAQMVPLELTRIALELP